MERVTSARCNSWKCGKWTLCEKNVVGEEPTFNMFDFCILEFELWKKFEVWPVSTLDHLFLHLMVFNLELHGNVIKLHHRWWVLHEDFLRGKGMWGGLDCTDILPGYRPEPCKKEFNAAIKKRIFYGDDTNMSTFNWTPVCLIRDKIHVPSPMENFDKIEVPPKIRSYRRE